MRSFYLRLWIDHIFGTYPPIYSHSWSLYMRICYMRDNFFGPYLSNITRSTCIYILGLHFIWRKNISAKAALNLLVKLAPSFPFSEEKKYKKLFFLVFSPQHTFPIDGCSRELLRKIADNCFRISSGKIPISQQRKNKKQNW